MISLFLYECRNRVKELLFLLFGVAWLMAGYFFVQIFPKAVLTIVELLNRYNWLKSLFGITENIESVTYENIMVITMIPLTIAICFHAMTRTANSILKEERMGGMLYFLTTAVPRTLVLFIKLIVGILILSLELLVFGILFWKLSLHGVPDHEFLQLMFRENTIPRLHALVCLAILSLSAGFLYGCISRKKTSGPFVRNLLIWGILLAFLPNILQCCVIILAEKNYDAGVLASLLQKLVDLRKYNPVYWSNPSAAPLIKDLISLPACIACGITMVVAGGAIYQKKEQ